jgi:hypothetical protein
MTSSKGFNDVNSNSLRCRIMNLRLLNNPSVIVVDNSR